MRLKQSVGTELAKETYPSVTNLTWPGLESNPSRVGRKPANSHRAVAQPRPSVRQFTSIHSTCSPVIRSEKTHSWWVLNCAAVLITVNKLPLILCSWALYMRCPSQSDLMPCLSWDIYIYRVNVVCFFFQIYLFIYWAGVEPSPLLLRPLSGILNQHSMIDDECGGMFGRGSRSALRKPSQCCFVHLKSHGTWPGPPLSCCTATKCGLTNYQFILYGCNTDVLHRRDKNLNF
jgi:hypothetical protein